MKGKLKRTDIPLCDLLYDQDCFEIFEQYIASHDTKCTICDLYSGALWGDDLDAQFGLRKLCEKELQKLDENKPFLKFGYPGTHYGYELFLSRPSWRLRGTPFLWAHCARAFSRDVLPMDPGYFEKKYRALFCAKGIPFDGNPEESTYCSEFAFGGMSSGSVPNDFGISTLSQLLARLLKY